MDTNTLIDLDKYILLAINGSDSIFWGVYDHFNMDTFGIYVAVFAHKEQ